MKRIFIVAILLISLILFGINFGLNSSYFAPQDEAMLPVIRIAGTQQSEINCEVPRNSNNQYTFEVDYTDVRSSEVYLMNTINYAPELDFDDVSQLGTQVNFSAADYFSESIPLFSFSYFDQCVNRMAIGENGLISLDSQQGGQINLRYPSSDIPSSSLTRNSIFAAHYDLMIHGVADAGVYYRQVGTYPARKMIITYRNADVFYCQDGSKTSVQVVLEELTNKIRIYIKEKSSACGAITNAVVGIQNQYGDLGYSPAGRDYSDGDWTAQNEAYEFVPNGDRRAEISWIEGPYTTNDPNNLIIGTGDQITVNADLTNLNYTVEVRYPFCYNQLGEMVDFILTDTITVAEDYPIGIDNSVIVCNTTVDLSDFNSYISVNPPANFNFRYFRNANLTNEITNFTTFPITGQSETVYVQIINPNDSSCYDVAVLEVASLYGLLELDINNLQLSVCDNVYSGNAEGTENPYTLSDLDNLILQEIPNGTIHYYNSASSTTPLNSINLTNGTQIWVEVEVTGTNSCVTDKIGPITINFYDVPEFVNIPSNLELAICDKNWDFVEVFGNGQTWQGFLASNGLVTNDPSYTVSVYSTRANAVAGTNALTQVTLDQSDPSYNAADNSWMAHYFVRVESQNGCFSIEEFNVRVRFYGVDAIDTPVFNVCVDENASIPLDLSCFIQNADFNNDGNSNEGMFNRIYRTDGTQTTDINELQSITYHLSNADAQSGNNPVDPNQTLTAENAGVKRFYVRFTLCDSCSADGSACYTVKSIIFRVVSTVPQTLIAEVCRTTDGATTVENLSIFNNQLFENDQAYTITYYDSESAAVNQLGSINRYTFTGDNYLWVRVRSNYVFTDNSCLTNLVTPCEGIYRVRFIFGAIVDPIVFPEQVINGVCDNNADGEEFFDVTTFESDIYNGEATFEYFADMNQNTFALTGPITDPTQVLFTTTEGTNSATKTVYIRMRYDGNACYDIISLTITLNFLPGIETENGFLCSCLPNPGTYSSYNLTDAINQIYGDQNEANGNYLSDMVVGFYNFYLDAENGSREILDPTNYQSIRGVEEIYVRFYSNASSCYSIDTLTLKNLVLPVPIPGDLQICDTNINGDYDMILSDLNEVVMPGNTDNYFFSYYWNYEDADNANNPIIQTPETDDVLAYFYEFGTPPSQIFVRVDADNGECPESAVISGSICAGINVVTLYPGSGLTLDNNVFELPDICDSYDETGDINNPTYNDGISDGIDLTQLESQILGEVTGAANITRLLYYETLDDMVSDEYPYGNNVIQNPENYTNRDPNGEPIETVYLKLETENNSLCPTFVEININIIKGPEIFPEEAYFICPGGMVDIRLIIPEGVDVSNYTFTWTFPDGTIVNDQYELLNIDITGTYSVQITDNATNCTTPVMNFEVREINPPQIVELIVGDNEDSIQVIATGYGDLPIEYSLDGENWQSSNTFEHLPIGVYTVWVKYRYNTQTCIGDPKTTILLKVNNVITPNGDGYNDCITINNLFVFGEEQTTLEMFDRYGKLIYVQKSNSVLEWCGFYQGRVLPTTNYWYRLTIPDGRQKSGYISLKNY